MYIVSLIKFLASILISKDEYNINSKHFNPIRIFVTVALVLNLFFTFFLMTEMVTIHDKIKTSCPALLLDLKKERVIQIK